MAYNPLKAKAILLLYKANFDWNSIATILKDNKRNLKRIYQRAEKKYYVNVSISPDTFIEVKEKKEELIPIKNE